MKQPDSTDVGTKMDLVRRRLNVAREDLDTVNLIFEEDQENKLSIFDKDNKTRSGCLGFIFCQTGRENKYYLQRKKQCVYIAFYPRIHCKKVLRGFSL